MSLNNTLEEMDLTDIYRAFHPKEAKYTFLSSVHGTFSKIDQMIVHKQASKNSRKLISYQVFSQTTKELKLETKPKGRIPKHSKS